MIRKVFVPLDGSRRAEEALDPARAVALAGRGSLVLFQAVPQAESSSLKAAEYVHRQRLRAAEYLHQLAPKVRQAGVPVEEHISTGDPSREIVAQAQKDGADLIVMSSHGRGGGQTWPFGSVAEKVLKATSLPLLVLRGAAVPAQGIRKILIGLDGSDSAMDVLPPACELAAALGAAIVLAHVGTHLPRNVYWAVDAVRNQGIPVRVRLLHGEPTATLMGIADEEQADLVAMTMARAERLEREPSEKVGRRIVAGLDRPLLLVQPKSVA